VKRGGETKLNVQTKGVISGCETDAPHSLDRGRRCTLDSLEKSSALSGRKSRIVNVTRDSSEGNWGGDRSCEKGGQQKGRGPSDGVAVG